MTLDNLTPEEQAWYEQADDGYPGDVQINIHHHEAITNRLVLGTMARTALPHALRELNETRAALNLTFKDNERNARELDAARAFKNFVHAYLTQHGVPEGDPTNQHQKEGCRIGARLDLLFAELDAARGEVERLTKDILAMQAGLEEWHGTIYQEQVGEKLKAICERDRLRSLLAAKDAALLEAERFLIFWQGPHTDPTQRQRVADKAREARSLS